VRTTGDDALLLDGYLSLDGGAAGGTPLLGHYLSHDGGAGCDALLLGLEVVLILLTASEDELIAAARLHVKEVALELHILERHC
jgi:hypothetical protein